jgi:MerR family transcriptional regulator/heat shock protein HspR
MVEAVHDPSLSLCFRNIQKKGLKRMAKEYWTLSEVVEIFQVTETFLSDLEEEDIICPECGENTPDKLFPPGEMEKLRIAKILMDEMDVNLPGVEIILRMRQDMIAMRAQFDAILEDLADTLRATRT